MSLSFFYKIWVIFKDWRVGVSFFCHFSKYMINFKLKAFTQRESSLAARKPSRASRSKKCHFAPFRPSYLDHICTRKLYPKLRFGSAMLSSERFFTLTALIKRKQSLAPLARAFFSTVSFGDSLLYDCFPCLKSFRSIWVSLHQRERLTTCLWVHVQDGSVDASWIPFSF